MENEEELRDMVSGLVEKLSGQIVESNSRIESIEQKCKTLIPKGVAKDWGGSGGEERDVDGRDVAVDDGQESKLTPEQEEEILIKYLQDKRLEVIGSLQQQEYVTEKLEELIEENEGLVSTVEEFLELRQEKRREAALESERRLQHYTENVVGPKMEQFDADVKVLQQNFDTIGEMLAKITGELGERDDTMLQNNYTHLLSEITKHFNEISHKEFNR